MNPNQTIVPTPTNITVANAPFYDEDADVLLRSSDKVDFRVFKMFLAFASPVFKDMFTLPKLPQGVSDGMKDDLPVIQMTEESRTIENILKFCYPVFTCRIPVLDVLEDVQALLKAADKYGMDDVVKYARGALIAMPLIEKDALRIFAIACRNRWEEEARVAARYTLRQPLWERAYVAELEHITAGDLHRLEQYHLKCVDHVRITTAWYGTADVSGPNCRGGCTIGYRATKSNGLTVYKSGWGGQYKEKVAAALNVRPCGETIRTPDFIDATLKAAWAECAECAKETSLGSELRKFSDKFAEEIDKVISEVELDLQFLSSE